MIQRAPILSTESSLRGRGRPNGVVIPTARNGGVSALTAVAVRDQGRTDRRRIGERSGLTDSVRESPPAAWALTVETSGQR